MQFLSRSSAFISHHLPSTYLRLQARRRHLMCRGFITFQDSAHIGRSEAPASSISIESADGSHPFKARRLTDSTFLIIEFDDVYDEHPFIYAKFIPTARTILLLDTGCGGKRKDPHKEITSLREFIEGVLVENLGVHAGRPLDVHSGGEMRYVVVLTHCHYDHIRTSKRSV